MNRALRRLGIGSLPIALLCWGSAVRAEQGYVGDETCAFCHEDVVKAFAKTPHAVAPGWDAERGCESCHGPGEAHAEGDPEAIERLGKLPPRELSETCLACHVRQQSHFSHRQSIHPLAEVGCIDCHNPHSTAAQLLDRTGRTLCADCHQAIASQFDLARAHPLSDGGKGCADCHEPHATRALRTNVSLFNETCGDCHFEKMGPFLYSHDVMIVDGCASCHRVHGSPNRHLLKHQTQVNLCYECHSGSVTPGFHSAPRFLNQKCTACHTAIHGSNTDPLLLEE